jgi:hypothetical protein
MSPSLIAPTDCVPHAGVSRWTVLYRLPLSISAPQTRPAHRQGMTNPGAVSNMKYGQIPFVVQELRVGLPPGRVGQGAVLESANFPLPAKLLARLFRRFRGVR